MMGVSMDALVVWQIVSVGIDAKPFIDDRNSVRVTVCPHTLPVKVIGSVREAKDHEENGCSVL
jgi:hypothetical protein